MVNVHHSGKGKQSSPIRIVFLGVKKYKEIKKSFVSGVSSTIDVMVKILCYVLLFSLLN